MGGLVGLQGLVSLGRFGGGLTCKARLRVGSLSWTIQDLGGLHHRLGQYGELAGLAAAANSKQQATSNKQAASK